MKKIQKKKLKQLLNKWGIQDAVKPLPVAIKEVIKIKEILKEIVPVKKLEEVFSRLTNVAKLIDSTKGFTEKELINLTKQIDQVANDLKEVKSIPKESFDTSELKTNLEKNLEEKMDILRTDLLHLARNAANTAIGSGQANRNILVAGNSSTLSRYTDLNIKAGGGVTLTHINNDTLKTTDLTISSPGGATAVYGEIVAGSGTSWTLAHTPVGSIALYVQGTRISSNRGDFSIVGANITTAVSYSSGDLESDYSY